MTTHDPGLVVAVTAPNDSTDGDVEYHEARRINLSQLNQALDPPGMLLATLMSMEKRAELKVAANPDVIADGDPIVQLVYIQPCRPRPEPLTLTPINWRNGPDCS